MLLLQLEEVRDRALEAYEELMGLDIFDAVDVVLGEGAKVRLYTASLVLPCWSLCFIWV